MGAFGEVVQDVRAILRSPRVPSSKFIAYFQLLDAFRVPGCPVCTLLEQGERKALDALLYEQVNDPFTRDRLVESHGFCNWHAWMLPGVHNSASGVALISRHLLSEALEQVTATLREVRPRSRWHRTRLALEFQILKLTADLKAHIVARQPDAGEQLPSAPAEGANPD